MLIRSLLSAVLLLLTAGALSQESSSAEPSASSSAEPSVSSSSSPLSSSSSPSSSSSSPSSIAPTSTTDPTPSSSDNPDADADPVTRCDKRHYVAIPFCEPKKHALWRTDGNYYVTWDDDIWAPNSTVLITINYASPGGAGRVAQRYEFANSKGYETIQPDEKWLLNQTLLDSGIEERVENQTLYFSITSDDVTVGGARNPHDGPTITLTSRPVPVPIDTSPRNRPPPSKLGLAVGLPLVLLLIIAAVCGTHFCMRKRRQIGPIAIGGRRKRAAGYSGRETRRKRAMGGGDTSYRDEDVDTGEDVMRPAGVQRGEWELASVKGGREVGAV